MSTKAISRVLIKVSGEALASTDASSSACYSTAKCTDLCKKIKNVVDRGIGVSLVVGGGNIIRGRDFDGNNCIISKETADSMGMLATAINGLMIRETLQALGVRSALVSTLPLPFSIERNDPFSISNLIDKNEVIIFVGGIGLPYFSTDTISIVAASMSKCPIVLKATKTDGIYDMDPNIHKNATRFEHISYVDAISRNLKIMDKTAFILAENLGIQIHVFSIFENDCFVRSIDNTITQSVVR